MTMVPCQKLGQSKKLSLSVIVSTLFVSFLSFVNTANAQMGGGLPTFQPTTGWSVNQTLISKNHGISDVKLPCMMATEFDNGYVVRIAGGDQKLMALAVDFRQQVFQQGRKYTAQVDVDGSFVQRVTATAFSNSVLLFNIRSLNGFYRALQNGQYMTLFVEDNGFKFALSDVASGINALESCYTGVPAATTQMALGNSGPTNMPTDMTADTMPLGMPTDMGDNAMAPITATSAKMGKVESEALGDTPKTRTASIGPQKMTPISPSVRPEMSTDRWNSRVSKPIDMPQGVSRNVTGSIAGTSAKMTKSANQTWRAKEGDDIRMTLERWATQADVAIDWQAGQSSGAVVENINYAGSFENAVQMLMAENSAAMGLEAQMQGSLRDSRSSSMSSTAGGAPMALRPIQTNQMPSQRTAMAPSSSMSGGKWNAQRGANLEQVLGDWSRKNNVELIWQSHQGFAVMRNVNSSGSFEVALQSLLGQYTNEAMRPAAQLNTDPTTGKRVLIVDATGAM